MPSYTRSLIGGVEVVFGLPGDGINGFMEALRKAQGRIRYVHMRHEEAAAMAACGYAKFSGKLGVCFSTAAPGAIHMLNGLYDAKIDQAPVLSITGMTYHDLIGTHYVLLSETASHSGNVKTVSTPNAVSTSRYQSRRLSAR